jgi:pyridoxal phosphate enzyme (YggS family)
MTILEGLTAVRAKIVVACESCGRDPSTVSLLPVSKRHPPAAILQAKATGLSLFGENRVQELVEKSEVLGDAGVEWHFVGSLQSNKVSSLLRVPSLVLVQSLDRIKLADALQLGLADAGRELSVLIQVNATGEESKHGATPAGAAELLRHVVDNCPQLRPAGVMAMGPLHGDPQPVFQRVASLHEDLRQHVGLPLPTRSMGMTDDMTAAIGAGSTMVRVGTGIFGPRP